MRLEPTVRIDGTHRPERMNLPEAVTPTGKPAASASVGPSGAAAASEPPKVEAHLQTYVDQAKEAREVNLQAIEEAKKLLASGTLDTPDAIRRAAQALMDLDF